MKDTRGFTILSLLYTLIGKVLNIEYQDHIRWGFLYRISDIEGDIGDTRAYRAFKSNTIYNEILITKSWFIVIDIIYQIKMMQYTGKDNEK